MSKNLGLLLTAVGLLVAVGIAEAKPAGAAGAKPLICPVMKKPIADKSKAPFLVVNNEPVHFCCAGCSASVREEPAKYLKQPLKDPVTGKPFKVTAKSPKMEHGGALFLFASAKTHETFHANPGKYARHGKHPAGNHH